MVHITPPRILLILQLLLSISITTVRAQDFLSPCDYSDARPPCRAEKFLHCMQNRCQCADPINQIYDFVLDTCVVMTGRKCVDGRALIKLGSSHTIDLDPRQLEGSIPKCANHAFCDTSSSNCMCKTGYFYNEENGQCELSFGKSCKAENAFGNAPLTQLSYSLSSNIHGCDSSLGLRCGIEGVCKCEDSSVWQMDRGCVSLGSSVNVKGNQTDSGNNLSSNVNAYNVNYYNGEYEGLTPFQRLVNLYALLIEANNPYYLNENETGQQQPQDEMDKIVFSSPDVNSTTNLENNSIGDRSQFPNGQQSPIWNLLTQQQQPTQQHNSISYNNNINNEQLAQLNKLLIQQQQLKNLINEINTLTTVQPATLQNFGQNNNVQQSRPTPQQVGSYWNNPSQQQPQYHPLFRGPFAFYRFYRNMVDPIKRTLFPNLYETISRIPSPLHVAASTANNFLPVLREFDKRFSPMLQSVVEYTKPKPRATTLPFHMNNGIRNYFKGTRNGSNQLNQQQQQPLFGRPGGYNIFRCCNLGRNSKNLNTINGILSNSKERLNQRQRRSS